MENPGNPSGESVGLVEDPPPPTITTQEQSTSESSSQPQQQQPRPPPPLSPLTGCYLLIVVGEPHSERHKEIILQKIAKAFLSWDINECHVSLEKELQIITGQSPEGEEARFGERLIQYATENLVTEILIHPQLNTLHQCMKNLLSSFTKHRHIIHAGYTFAGNGSWILQDGTLSISDLVEALHEPEVLRVLKAYENSVSIDVHCAPEGDWATERFQKEPVSKLCSIRINPGDVMTAGNPAISAFIDYLSPFLEPANIQQLLQPTDVVGNIRFTHPTLYVFPGGQGDAALFGINGFNMLIDGGFARKACFWDFARHLDRLDAVLLTRLNNSTVNGISAVLQRKKMNHVYPQIGHFFCNLQDRKIALSPDGDKDKDSLIVNLAEEGQEIVANLRHLALKPHPCYRDGNQVDPVNLYHKVGHGKLDMYVISPARDSQAVKEFLAKWSSNDSHLFSQTGKKIAGKAFEFPLQNLVSICALLVWQPANPNDTITRILFPGSTPQHKIFEGLEKLRHLEFLKHPVCSAKSISPSASTAAISRSISKTRQQKVIDNKQKETKAISKPQLKPVKTKTEKTPPKEVKSKLDTNKLADEKNELETIKEPVKKIENTEEPLKKLDNRILSKDEQIENIKKEIQKIEQAENEEQKKRIVHRSKYDMRFVKSKVDSRAPSKSIDRKKVPEKKVDGETSPTGTPKKSLTNGTATKAEKARVGAKPAKASSPVSTPAKSAKEANNRKVVEARVTSRSSSKSVTRKKEEAPPPPPPAATKPERKPISRRPKASLSPVKSSAGKPSKIDPESIPKKVKKLDIDSTVVKAVGQTISKELEKGSETEKTEIEEKKDGVVEIKKLEAETENKETDEKAVKSELESAHVGESNKEEEEEEEDEEEEEEEEEEEYLIVTKEESTEESVKEDEVEEEAQTKDETEGEGEMKKLLREEEESEKKRESIERTDKKDKETVETEEKLSKVDEKDSEDATGEQESSIGKKRDGSEEKIPEEGESELQKLMEVDEGIDLKEPVSKEHKEAESLPEEKISNTLETSATTAPTLPEDERIEEPVEEVKEQPEEIKEVVEEKYIQEKTKEEKDEEEKEPEQPNPPSTADDEGFPVPIPIVQKKPRDVVKTPDEVADLPMHEEVDPRMYSSGEFTKDFQKKQDGKPDLKEQAEDDGDILQQDDASETAESKKGEEAQLEDKNAKDSITSKYLNIIDELEKTTTESKEKPVQVKETSKEDEFEKSEELKTEDRKPSSQTDEVDSRLPKHADKEKYEKTVQKEMPSKIIAQDLVREISGKSSPIEGDTLKDSTSFTTQNAEKQTSGKSTPVEHEKDSSHEVEKQSLLLTTTQPKESCGASAPDHIEKIAEVLRESTPQNTKDISERSTPLEVDKEAKGISGKSTYEELGKQTFEKSAPQEPRLDTSGKSTPHDLEKEVSGKLTPHELEVGTSGKSTPHELEKETSNKSTPQDLEAQTSGKLSPLELGKEGSEKSKPHEVGEISGRLTPQELEKEASRKSTPQDLEVKTSEKSTPHEAEKEASRQPTPQDLEVKTSEKSTPHGLEKELSGKSTPQDLEVKTSGKSTPYEVEKDASGKSTPQELGVGTPGKSTLHEAEKEASRQPTPQDLKEKTSEKSTPRGLEKELSGKSTPQESGKKDSGKSTPDEKDLTEELSREPTPQDLAKDVSGKSSPSEISKNIPEKSTSQNLEEKTSDKSAPQVLDKEGIPETSTKDLSGKSSPVDSKNDISGKTSPKDLHRDADIHPEKLGEDTSRTPTPAEPIKDVSGKSSPQDLGKEISGEVAPKKDSRKPSLQETEKPSIHEDNLVLRVSNLQDSGKDLSEKSHEKILEKLDEHCGKSFPKDSKKVDVKDGSGKSTPLETVIGDHAKSTPGGLIKDICETPPLEIGEESTGKSTPQDHEGKSLGKSPTPDTTGKSTPLEISRQSTPHELDKDISGKSTPQDLRKEVLTVSTPLETSGKNTPQDLETPRQSTPQDLVEDVSRKSTPRDAQKEELNTAPLDVSGKSTPEDIAKETSEHSSPQELEKNALKKATPEDLQKEKLKDLDKETFATLQPEKLDKDISRTSTPVEPDKDISGKSTPQSTDKEVSRQATPQDLAKGVSGKSTPQDLAKDTLKTEESSGKTTPKDLDLGNEGLPSAGPKDVSGKSSPAELNKERSGHATPKDFAKESSRTSSPQKDTCEKHDLEKPVALEQPTFIEAKKVSSGKSSPQDLQRDVPSGKTTSKKVFTEELDKLDKLGMETPGKTIETDKSGKSTPQDEKDSSRRTSKDMSGKITPDSEKGWSGKTSRRESLAESSNKSSPVPASQEGRTTPESLSKDKISLMISEKAENGKSGKISPDVKSEKVTSTESIKEKGERIPEKDTKKVADSVSDSVSSGPVEKDLSGKSTPFSTDKEISGKVSPQVGGRVTSDSFSLAMAEKGTSGTYSLEKESCEKVSSPSPVDISPLSLDELRDDAKEKTDQEKDIQGGRRITEIHKTQLEKVKFDEASSGTSTPDRSQIEKSDTSLPNGVESEEECEKGILESERQEKESQILDISSGEEEELKALEEEDEDSEPEIRKGDLEGDLTKEIAKDEKEDINKQVKAETEEELADAKAGVKRMLVTASSEDGGTETEICLKGGVKIVKEMVDDEKGKKEAEEEKETEFSNLILQAREEYNSQRSRKTSCNGSEGAEEVEEKVQEGKDDVEEELSTLLMQARQELAYVRSKSRENNESGIGRMYGMTKTTTTSETTRMDDDDLITITTILTEEREEQEDGTVKVTTTKETTTKGGKDEGTVVTVNTKVEKKDEEEASQLNSSGDKRSKRGSKEEGEKTSQEEVIETSRRTSASSIISQEDLVSRKDSAKLEDFRQSSTEMSPLKTTYITSHGDSESLMTSSFYGNLPTEDEMIGRAEHVREFRKGKGYESFTEIGPNGERTERTYFYGREDDPRGSRDNKSRFVKAYYTEDGQQSEEEQSRFVHKYYPSDIPEEETLEKTHFEQRFYTEETSKPDSDGKFRFVETVSEEPVERMDFAKAVDEHMLARGEFLGKDDLTKYSPGKAKVDEKEEKEEEREKEEASGLGTSTEKEKKKDVIEDWGKPLGLPLPPKNMNKNYGFPGQNISTTSSLSTPTDNSDSVNNWGQPMSLPSPAPPATQNGTAETLSGKGVSTIKETPKKEKKIQPKKNISDNNKSSGTNTPNRRSESPVKQTERRTPSTGRSNRSAGGYVYLDLTYVPHHGNSYYSNVEFFKKVRARYYVFSGTEPSKEVYNALLEAKQTWENKQLEVTIIPTYDTDVLGYWVAENEEILAKHKIDLSPSASRCTINLQDHETSCSAYRLEF